MMLRKGEQTMQMLNRETSALLGVAPVPTVGRCIRNEQPERSAALVKAFLGERFG